MKLNITKLFILLLVISNIIFGCMWFYKKDTLSDYKITQLEIANKKLKNDRDSIDIVIYNKNKNFSDLKKNEVYLENRVQNYQNKLNDQILITNKSKQELDNLRIKLNESIEKINEYKENPANRVGDDLIESLKNKTKK